VTATASSCSTPGGGQHRPSRVHLVGAGPGPADLLTLRAARLLAAAEVVIHDQLVTDDVLALTGPNAEVIPAGRRQGRVVARHEEVVDLLVAAARAGRRAVRLKGGDPVVLGRGGEEALDLAARGVACELVPGVTSAVAAPELAGIPVTHRGVAPGFLVLTAKRAPQGAGCGSADADWELAGRFSGTVVVLMGATRLGELCARLQAHGRAGSTPAGVVSHAGLPTQRTVRSTLAGLPARAAAERLETPAVLVVGEVVDVPDEVGHRLAAASRAVHA
jgi:uroporphyrin-III C-methyltransferase / precorrin-2 dehydrogenase / sirohydrochlorin ferrochelatase